MMLDDQLDDLLREAAQDYNSPPETPSDLMWARIVAAREEANAEKTPILDKRRKLPRPQFRHLFWPAGIAALLAVGVGLGRLTSDKGSRAAPLVLPAPVAIESTPRQSAVAYQLATTEHLGQSEAFLTLFRTSVRQGADEHLASATARQLLATNRLLLDSPAANDARTRTLLQDLELVLAEISQLSPEPRSRDLEFIKKGLEEGGVLSRLRTAVPSGTSATQGVL
jgi:hypothetical protein